MKVLWMLLVFGTLSAHIHVIGDSHVTEFAGIPGCILHHIGPILMHRVGRDGLHIVNLKRLGVKEGDSAVYVFGEIDVRCHIVKQWDLKSRDPEEIIESLANKYIETILTNRSQYKEIHSVVYNVVPPHKSAAFNPEYPVYGTIENRVYATRLLNDALKRLCDQNGIYFLDIYDAYAEEDGSLSVECSDGNVHIDAKYNIPIQQRLFELIPFKFP